MNAWELDEKYHEISFLKINLPIWLLRHVELPEIIGQPSVPPTKFPHLRLYKKMAKITKLPFLSLYYRQYFPWPWRMTFQKSLSELIYSITQNAHFFKVISREKKSLNFLCSYLDLLVDYSYALDAFHYWSQLYLETEPRLPLSNSKSQTMRVPETIRSIQKTEIDSFTRVSLF